MSKYQSEELFQLNIWQCVQSMAMCSVFEYAAFTFDYKI